MESQTYFDNLRSRLLDSLHRNEPVPPLQAWQTASQTYLCEDDFDGSHGELVRDLDAIMVQAMRGAGFVTTDSPREVWIAALVEYGRSVKSRKMRYSGRAPTGLNEYFCEHVTLRKRKNGKTRGTSGKRKKRSSLGWLDGAVTSSCPYCGQRSEPVRRAGEAGASEVITPVIIQDVCGLAIGYLSHLGITAPAAATPQAGTVAVTKSAAVSAATINWRRTLIRMRAGDQNQTLVAFASSCGLNDSTVRAIVREASDGKKCNDATRLKLLRHLKVTIDEWYASR